MGHPHIPFLSIATVLSLIGPAGCGEGTPGPGTGAPAEAVTTSESSEAGTKAASAAVFASAAGPSIQCMHPDAPTQASAAYMVQRAPSTLVIPVHIADAFNVQAVTINGVPATFNASSGNYEAGVASDFGMTFANVVATDQVGTEISTTCFALVAERFTAEDAQLPGAIGMRLDPDAIDAPQPGGLHSINDILRAILSSAQLRGLVDSGLVAANPINSGGCGVFACSPRVNYNAASVTWDSPATTLILVPGGLEAHVTLPNVRASVNACGTTCCVGGSTVTVRATSVDATVGFGLALRGGVLRATLQGAPAVTVGSVSLDGSGFCGILVDLLQSFVTGTVRNAVDSALLSLINSSVVPLLDQLVSSLDIRTLATAFSVPRLDGAGSLGLQFGLGVSSFEVTSARALLGFGTRFSPAAAGHDRPSLGVPRRAAAPLLDPPGTSGLAPVGVSLYEGVLNQVLHGLWRGGLFQATLPIGAATATVDAQLPPVAAITGDQAQLMLGGVQATIRIPGVINTPISVVFGGQATASVSLTGDVLSVGNVTVTQLFIASQTTIFPSQRPAVTNLLTQVLQTSLGDALNHGLPAFPIPSFALPASAAVFGLPAGAQLGIVAPTLSASSAHVVLTGPFGVRN